ncbi:MAG: 50S ribosomal protein L3 N(5)-glutamine methyltransferase [Succinivibrionaceae bacterium]|nr:50S ribosomal protein L3 N(5)-glutamine methyltransferase [Succinivibrionaceae bacterium]
MEPPSSNASALAFIHESLDTPITREEITKAICEELLTVQDVCRFMVTCFASHDIYLGHGTDSYWAEALEIIESVMHLQPPCDDSTLGSRLTARERALIARIVVERVFSRIPTPYLTQRAFFCGHEFYVDERVIIPRSPIAELIDDGFAPYFDRTPDRVLDLCTGSGCIAIATALQFDGDIEVDAVDISDEALEVARINIEAYGLEHCVTPIKSDLFDALPKGDRYDLIVTNPPYVAPDEFSGLPAEYGREPELAFVSGHDGLDIASRILTDAKDWLQEDGILVMEVGNSEEHLSDAFPGVRFHFIDLKKGGTGVFIFSHDQLVAYHDIFSKALGERQ